MANEVKTAADRDADRAIEVTSDFMFSSFSNASANAAPPLSA
jgi:hypothetical protein